MTTRSIPAGCISIIGAGALLGAGAHAQDTGEGPDAAERVPVLTEVTVTAERRESTVQDTAAAITAVTGAELETLGVVRPEDLARVSPAVHGTTAGGVFTQYYIRGVGNFSGNAFADPAVAYNVDGVYVARPTTYGGMFYDLARVEALKGPQGTLYGRNATGGAINLITARPELDDFGGYFGIEAGEFSLIRANGALNVPVSERFALRGAFQTVDRDGYLSDDTEDEEVRAGRLSALFVPSEDATLHLVADYQDVGTLGGAVISPFLTDDPWLGALSPQANAVLGAGPFRRAPLGSPPPETDITSWGVLANLEWDLGATALTVLPAYRDADTRYVSYTPGFLIDVDEAAEQTSLEVRLASSDAERVQWVTGAYYFDEQIDATQFYLQSIFGSPVENSTLTEPLRLDTESWALFADARVSLTEPLRLILGARYTEEDKGMRGTVTTNPPGPAVITVPAIGEASFDSTDWRAGFEYDLREDSLLYLTVSTGFKAGGFWADVPPNNFYRPEELTAYALGSKNRFLDNRLQLNAEVFYWDYEDHQESYLTLTPGGYTVFNTQNIGQATMQGVEIESEWLVGRNGTLSAQLQYLDAEFDEFSYQPFSPGPPLVGCPATNLGGPFWSVNCDGFPAIRAPEWSGTVGYTHAFPLGNGGQLVGDLRMQFATESYVSIDYLPASLQDDYTMSDAALTYESPDGRWQLGAWVRNIEDEAVITNAFVSPFTTLSYAQIRAPRTYGARFAVNF